MGGTDDPSNLVELTIEEHAEAHRKLFEEPGRWQDELAWKGLAKIIGKQYRISAVLEPGNSPITGLFSSSPTCWQRADFEVGSGNCPISGCPTYVTEMPACSYNARSNGKMQNT